MKFEGQLIKKNFEQYIMPSFFSCDLAHSSPYHLKIDGKLFYLDVKHIKFLDESFALEGIIANEKQVFGRCLIEFKNG